MITRATLVLCLLAMAGCPLSASAPEERAAAQAPKAAVESPPHAPDPVPLSPEMVVVEHGLKTTVSVHVVSALQEAKADGYQLVVYVGAPWCEPCRRFHDAVKAGELNEAFAGIRFLEFDHDAHQEGLKAAGYLRRFVPLFALPKPDGTASQKIHQGAIKGPGAVDFIVPRLKAMLATATERPVGG